MAGFLGNLKEKVTGGASEAAEAASGAASTVGAAASSAADKVDDALPDIVKEYRDKLLAQAEEFAAEKKRMLKEFEEEKKRALKNAIMSRFEKLYQYGMDVTGTKIKDKLKDPYMPGFVQVMVDEIVDIFWPDITGEVREQLLSGAAPKVIINHGEPGCVCCGQFIGWLRYQLVPYDRSIWRLLRNPIWWLFTLASLVPRFGIGMIVYMLYFLLLDCGDQFQMESYIVDFKALQFLTLGVVAAIAGSIQYYICISQEPPTCHDVAPKEEVWTLLIFVLQIFFVWLAFCLLQKAKKKGGYHYMYSEASKAQQAENVKNGTQTLDAICVGDQESFTGGIFAELQYQSEEEMGERSRRRLTKFLIYDVVIFIVCLGLVCWLVFANALDNQAQPSFNDGGSWSHWKLAMSFYWVKAFYGLMSFPFAVLKLPVLKTLVSHAKRTGYNPYGNCVVYLGKEEEDHLCPWKPGPHPESERPPAPGAAQSTSGGTAA